MSRSEKKPHGTTPPTTHDGTGEGQWYGELNGVVKPSGELSRQFLMARKEDESALV
jgi:hypothetical protein